MEGVEYRFGYIAEKKGYITADELIGALEIQVRENIDKKEHRFIGNILCNLGYITEDQINKVLNLASDKMALGSIV